LETGFVTDDLGDMAGLANLELETETGFVFAGTAFAGALTAAFDGAFDGVLADGFSEDL
jgi:hypothetical protein